METRSNTVRFFTYILYTFYVHSMYILCTFYVHSMDILCTFYLHSMYILWTFYGHSMYILCTFYVHSMDILWTFNVHSMYILCIFYVHSIYILCTFQHYQILTLKENIEKKNLIIHNVVADVILLIFDLSNHRLITIQIEHQMSSFKEFSFTITLRKKPKGGAYFLSVLYTRNFFTPLAQVHCERKTPKSFKDDIQCSICIVINL